MRPYFGPLPLIGANCGTMIEKTAHLFSQLRLLPWSNHGVPGKTASWGEWWSMIRGFVAKGSLVACTVVAAPSILLSPRRTPRQQLVVDICDRTPEVETAILAAVSGATCSTITDSQLLRRGKVRPHSCGSSKALSSWAFSSVSLHTSAAGASATPYPFSGKGNLENRRGEVRQAWVQELGVRSCWRPYRRADLARSRVWRSSQVTLLHWHLPQGRTATATAKAPLWRAAHEPPA